LIQVTSDRFNGAARYPHWRENKWEDGCDCKVLYVFTNPVRYRDLKQYPEIFNKWKAYKKYNFQGKSFPIPKDIWNKLDQMAIENDPRRYPGYRQLLIRDSLSSNLIPEEVNDDELRYEGAGKKILVNTYERDEVARKKCLEHYGYACSVCEQSLSDIYGKIAQKCIHVHHLKPLSEINSEYRVDPIEDLRPVCPNCHAIIHARKSPYSIEEVKEFIKYQASGDSGNDIAGSKPSAM